MELNINTPAYFNQHYGIDDEVYRFCQNAYMYFKDKEYSDTLHTIGIAPVAAPQELYETRDKWTQNGCLHTFLCLWVPQSTEK